MGFPHIILKILSWILKHLTFFVFQFLMAFPLWDKISPELRDKVVSYYAVDCSVW